jgi:hypothetical protein
LQVRRTVATADDESASSRSIDEGRSLSRGLIC